MRVKMSSRWLRLMLSMGVAAMPSIACAHQVFRITDGSTPVVQEIEPPALRETAVYDAPDCSIFASSDGARLFAIPTKLIRIPGRNGALLGASLESEPQDHIVVILLHGIDRGAIENCIKEFQLTDGSGVKVELYPSSVYDIELLSDPNDFRVLKFHFQASSASSIDDNFRIMTIIQSSSRRNITTIKKALAGKLDALAKIKIKILKKDGSTNYETVTVPVDIGDINLSSQGL
ncbi:hypothetical protein [Mesorhizobium sp. M1396]|uniref:hypothetical protein n=1 Tax=Mesorhizobium sp. M1396 TaxID=2957095 RepID=UPI00333D8AC1